MTTTPPRLPTATPTKPPRPALRKKAASLLEAGMIMGLIAVGSIGAVFSTGESAKEVFCTADSAIVRALGWGEGTCIAQNDEPGGGGEGTGGGGEGTGGGGEGTGGGTDPDSGGGDGGGTGPEDPLFFGGMDLDGATYAAYSQGHHFDLAALPEGHGGGLSFALENGTSDMQACVQTPLGISCTQGTITADASALAVGWRATLPEDVRLPFERTFNAVLSNSTETLRRWDDLTVTRDQAPALLALSAGFADVVHPTGFSGTYTNLQPLIGPATPNLRLRTGANEPIQACHQATEGGTVVCQTTTNAAPLVVPEGAYAIGYRGNDVPEDPRVEYNTRQNLALYSTIDSTDLVEWSFLRSRAATPIALSWNDPSPIVYPAGTLGEQYAMFPLTGTFNGPMNLAITGGIPNGAPDWAGSYALCVQATAESAPACSDNVGQGVAATPRSVPQDTYAVGFRIVTGSLPTNTKAPWGGTANVQLYSTLDNSVRNYKNLTVSREQEPITFEPSFSLANSTWQSIEPENTGLVTKMVPLTGTFNDPLTMRTNQSGASNIQMCTQAVSGGTISCTTNSTLAVLPTAHAIGMRYTFPAGATAGNRITDYATTNQPSFRLEATNDTDQFVTWSPRMERLPVSVPTANRTLAIPANTTGVYEGPNWNGSLLMRSGAGESARITLLDATGGASVSLCGYSTGSSSGTHSVMCSPYISAVGQTATRGPRNSSDRFWLRVNVPAPTGTARSVQVRIEFWNSANSTTSLRSYTVTAARP